MNQTTDNPITPEMSRWGIASATREEAGSLLQERQHSGKAGIIRQIADSVILSGTPLTIPITDGKAMGMSPATLRNYIGKVCGRGAVSVTFTSKGLLVDLPRGSVPSPSRKRGRAELLADAAASPDNLGRGLFLLPLAAGLSLEAVKHHMTKICPDGYLVAALTKDQAPHTPNGVRYAKFGFVPHGTQIVRIANPAFLTTKEGVQI